LAGEKRRVNHLTSEASSITITLDEPAKEPLVNKDPQTIYPMRTLFIFGSEALFATRAQLLQHLDSLDSALALSHE
jgi:hypothetical protein